MYELIALDVDGTLLNPQHHLTERNRAAIRLAQSRGAKVILATGKQYITVVDLVNELGLTDLHITANGAVITDPVSGAILFQQGVPEDLGRRVLELAAEIGITLVAARDGRVYARELNEDTAYMGEFDDPEPIITPDLTEILKPNPTHFMAIAYRKDELYERAERIFRAEFGEQLRITRSSPYYLEFVHPAVSKGAGLRQVAGMLNIPLEKTLVVGDSFNDLSMFAVAGRAVSMGHSAPEVKAAAHEVTATNAEDGVALVLEKYFF